MATDIVRSSHGLVDALFSTIDKLNAKEIDAEHARAISHTARSIVSIARLELEFREFEKVNGQNKLTSLVIENKPVK